MAHIRWQIRGLALDSLSQLLELSSVRIFNLTSVNWNHQASGLLSYHFHVIDPSQAEGVRKLGWGRTGQVQAACYTSSAQVVHQGAWVDSSFSQFGIFFQYTVNLIFNSVTAIKYIDLIIGSAWWKGRVFYTPFDPNDRTWSSRDHKKITVALFEE